MMPICIFRLRDLIMFPTSRVISNFGFVFGKELLKAFKKEYIRVSVLLLLLLLLLLSLLSLSLLLLLLLLYFFSTKDRKY